MGVEGLDVIPQLIISNSNVENNETLVLLDDDVTTCVQSEPCSNQGNLFTQGYKAFKRLQMIEKVKKTELI